MKLWLKLLICLNAANTLGASLDERIKKVAPYFDPPVGQNVSIETEPALPIKAIEKDIGYIRIAPPAGTCIVVKRSEKLRDVKICKPHVLSFKYEDLDLQGYLRWLVFEKENDMGIPIAWPSPYRFGKYIDAFDTTTLVPFILRSCDITHNGDGSRKIRLTLAGGVGWSVDFPKTDALVPQPKQDKPNLYVQSGIAVGGFVKVETQAQKEAREKSYNPDLDIQDESNPDFIKTPWQIHPRNSYYMNGANFKTDDRPPLLKKTVCRYRYPESSQQDAEFECRNIYKFRWLYMHLACLEKPKSK